MKNEKIFGEEGTRGRSVTYVHTNIERCQLVRIQNNRDFPHDSGLKHRNITSTTYDGRQTDRRFARHRHTPKQKKYLFVFFLLSFVSFVFIGSRLISSIALSRWPHVLLILLFGLARHHQKSNRQ